MFHFVSDGILCVLCQYSRLVVDSLLTICCQFVDNLWMLNMFMLPVDLGVLD